MFTVFDLETTGLSTTSDDIIQFAYATFDDNNLVIAADVLYFYYDSMSWSEEAYAIHNISIDFLKTHAEKFEENIIKMWTVLSGANVIGHNIKAFDCPFASNWLARFGLVGLRFGVIQDTMYAFKPLTGGHRTSLVKLCEKCMIMPDAIKQMASIWFPNESEQHAHNAAYDVAATAMLTMLGLRKHYITFDMSEINLDDMSNVDVSLLESSTPLPTSDKVAFHLAESDGTVVEHQFVSDAEKYKHPTSIIEKDSLFFPVTLTCEDEGFYSYDDGEVLFTLRTTKFGDVFEVKHSMGTLNTPSLNLRVFTEGYSKKGV